MKSILFTSLVLAALRTPVSEPVTIVQGTEASTCEWPSVVALRDAGGSQFCTGTLVHPRLVITAGHCVEPTTGLSPSSVAFGEDADAPAGVAEVEHCAWHPEYEFTVTGAEQHVFNDVAYCVLAEPVEGLPIVPVAIGCEADAREPDAAATIVGFGASAGGVVGGQPWAEGTGRKRWTTQTIQSIDDANAKAIVAGDAGNSACLGDSGGPLLRQLEDGTWRLFGVASAAMLDSAQECGAGAIYQLVSSHVAWIEQDAGIDLSACFAADGTWAPDEACAGFPTAPGESDAEWADACATIEHGGSSATCGAAFEGGTGDGGSGSSSSGSDDDGVDGTSGVGDVSTGDGSSSDGGSSSGSNMDADSEDVGGCACTSSGKGEGGALAVLAMLVAGLRRVRRSRRGRGPTR
jgi:MYXO-CTERM domain-containing protein